MKITFKKDTIWFSFRRILTVLFFLVSSITFTGCGGGDTGWPDASSGTEQTVSPTQKIGYLVDSAIWGVDYSCGTITGTTKEDGEFTYDSSKCATTGIKFSLGNLILGTILPTAIKNDNMLTIQELAGEARYNVTNTNVTKIAVFLQSLDADKNVSNGIEIK